mmetsp:Transcript_20587/g.42206  ORF Transcript_20587/g.42206 Transcript_20587/m.42206 type:complete len:226 (+) Transcript_20587:383-1060(+)
MFLLPQPLFSCLVVLSAVVAAVAWVWAAAAAAAAIYPHDFDDNGFNRDSSAAVDHENDDKSDQWLRDKDEEGEGRDGDDGGGRGGQKWKAYSDLKRKQKQQQSSVGGCVNGVADTAIGDGVESGGGCCHVVGAIPQVTMHTDRNIASSPVGFGRSWSDNVGGGTVNYPNYHSASSSSSHSQGSSANVSPASAPLLLPGGAVGSCGGGGVGVGSSSSSSSDIPARF